MSGTVTSEISTDDFTTQIAEIYGVEINDVETSVDYVTSGILGVSIPENIPEANAISALTESISDVLGVHSSDVVVTIDEDGVVTFSVIGESYDDVQDIQSLISDADFASDITIELNEGDSGVVVESATLRNDIEVILSATVDTSDATGTADPIEEVTSLTHEYGLTDSIVEGIFEIFNFNFLLSHVLREFHYFVANVGAQHFSNHIYSVFCTIICWIGCVT